jgi:nucleoside-diphosphate-sugar epimerase
MTSSSSTTKTVLFLGATGGCGLSALRRSLHAGYACTALCRTPSKMTAIFPQQSHPNLTIVEGNAHDEAAVGPALLVGSEANRMVDFVVTSIGAAFSLKKMGMEDAAVCEKGMKVLLAAIAAHRKHGVGGMPRIVAVSSTGVSKFCRDIPLAVVPVYRTIIKAPHKDKRAMEDVLAASNEAWIIIRPSLLVDGEESSKKAIRVGIEHPVDGVEVKAIGFKISREDVGRWIFDEILAKDGETKYVGKIASITH